MRNEIVASAVLSLRRPKTLPPRRFHDVISPSTQTDPHVATNPRIVSFRRDTDVGACEEESFGRTESGGGGSPATGSGWNVVMQLPRSCSSARAQGPPVELTGEHQHRKRQPCEHARSPRSAA